MYYYIVLHPVTNAPVVSNLTSHNISTKPEQMDLERAKFVKLSPILTRLGGYEVMCVVNNVLKRLAF